MSSSVTPRPSTTFTISHPPLSVDAYTSKHLTQDYSLHDPPLTDLGVEQCSTLRKNLISTFSDSTANPQDVAIIVSPMRRTLQTAMLSLDWLVDRGVKIEGNADWQGEPLSLSASVNRSDS